MGGWGMEGWGEEGGGVGWSGWGGRSRNTQEGSRKVDQTDKSLNCCSHS